MSATVIVHPSAIERRPLFAIQSWADRFGLIVMVARTKTGRSLLLLERDRRRQ